MPPKFAKSLNATGGNAHTEIGDTFVVRSLPGIQTFAKPSSVLDTNYEAGSSKDTPTTSRPSYKDEYDRISSVFGLNGMEQSEVLKDSTNVKALQGGPRRSGMASGTKGAEKRVRFDGYMTVDGDDVNDKE